LAFGERYKSTYPLVTFVYRLIMHYSKFCCRSWGMKRQTGYLVLADVSSYTSFVVAMQSRWNFIAPSMGWNCVRLNR
jgi:hypothetical protein